MKEKFADLSKYVPILARYPNVVTAVETFCGITQVRRWFAESAKEDNPFLGVSRRAEMGVTFHGEKIPNEGPVVVVANHAYGAADALALAGHCLGVRDDVKILANSELTNLEGVGKWLLSVSLLQEGSAAKENSASLRAMLKHVKVGGCVVIFPAGKVAVWRDGGMQDPPWSEHMVYLIQRMKAQVIPVWFFGGTAPWIQVLSQPSVFIRRALIPRGLVAMKGKEIVARVGAAFSSEELAEKKEEGTSWLRRKLEQVRDSGN